MATSAITNTNVKKSDNHIRNCDPSTYLIANATISDNPADIARVL